MCLNILMGGYYLFMNTSNITNYKPKDFELSKLPR